MTLNSTQRLTDAGYAITHGQDTCYDLPLGKRESKLEGDQGKYRLVCSAGICTVQQSVPKTTSFKEDALQALAAILTLGLTSCSSNAPEKEWEAVSEFKDSTADTVDISNSPEINGVDATDTQLVSQVCIDSDGNNPFDVGFVVTDPNTSQKKTHIDVCKDSNFLYEQTCDGNQYKQVIVKCKDVLPGGMCVENKAGGKCDLAAKYVDAGTSSEMSDDVVSSPDTIITSDVPPVDYLKDNPLPLALDQTQPQPLPISGIWYGKDVCLNNISLVKVIELSQCLYLKALYTIDGVPIVASSYTDLVKKIASGGTYFMAIVDGDNKYPSTAVGKLVAFKHLESASYGIPANGFNYANYNNPIIWANGYDSISIQFYNETPSSDAGCYSTYLAPNGFANCVK